MTMSTTN